MKRTNPTTGKVGHKEPDRYPLDPFGKRLANRVNRKMAKLAASQQAVPPAIQVAISQNLRDLL